jgi:hypothetical protein
MKHNTVNNNVNNKTLRTDKNIKAPMNENESHSPHSLPNPNLDTIPNSNYDPFDFEISPELIEENKKINLNLVRHRHDHKKKFAPFTRSQRRKRRMEVYKLHFENGIPATRIAELMKVDRNTINNDLKILYHRALQDYNPDDMTLSDILQKQLFRLETQRDRLGIYLCDAKDVTDKIAIERLIADIDFKLIKVIEKIDENLVRFWEEIIKHINQIAENEKLKTRFTNLFELRRISIESGESLRKLREQYLHE